MIDPVIVEAEGRATAEEGCLSIPEIYGDVTRPERIVIEAVGPGRQPLPSRGHRAQGPRHPARDRPSRRYPLPRPPESGAAADAAREVPARAQGRQRVIPKRCSRRPRGRSDADRLLRHAGVRGRLAPRPPARAVHRRRRRHPARPPAGPLPLHARRRRRSRRSPSPKGCRCCSRPAPSATSSSPPSAASSPISASSWPTGTSSGPRCSTCRRAGMHQRARVAPAPISAAPPRSSMRSSRERRETGVSIMVMEAGLDSGPVLHRVADADRAPTTPPAPSPPGSRSSARRRWSRRCRCVAAGAARPAAAGPRRRDVRAQDRPRARADRLVARRGGGRAADPGVRSRARAPGPSWVTSRSSCSRRGCRTMPASRGRARRRASGCSSAAAPARSWCARCSPPVGAAWRSTPGCAGRGIDAGRRLA